MYDWSITATGKTDTLKLGFSCCWKDVRLKLDSGLNRCCVFLVSVVVERMYDWSQHIQASNYHFQQFQLLLKGCTIEACLMDSLPASITCFSCCWKDVRLKQFSFWTDRERCKVSVVVERMYDWSTLPAVAARSILSFSCCWKDVRLKPLGANLLAITRSVSVVVERMYDWSLDLSINATNLIVSVVVERMYDWSLSQCVFNCALSCFSCCWKDVRLKLKRFLLKIR